MVKLKTQWIQIGLGHQKPKKYKKLNFLASNQLNMKNLSNKNEEYLQQKFDKMMTGEITHEEFWQIVTREIILILIILYYNLIYFFGFFYILYNKCTTHQ